MAEPMVACGNYFTVFLKGDGSVWSCGNVNNQSTPSKIEISGVNNVVCGGRHAIFLKSDGTVWGFGGNSSGQLGIGNRSDQLLPAQVPITGVKSVACGENHTFFIKNDGTVWGSGNNSEGELGIDNTTNQVKPVKCLINGVKKIVAGRYHTIFLKNDSTVWGCGRNGTGELGLGNLNQMVKPVQIGISNVKDISCGYMYTIILKNDGTAMGCGYNPYGALGVGYTSTVSTLVQADINNIKEVICGGHHTFFIKADGTVWGSGKNDNGQLVLNDRNNRLTPVQVLISDCEKIICGFNYTVCLKKNNTLWCCGDNDYGQLGNGTNEDQLRLSQIVMNLLVKYMLLQDRGQYKTVSESQLKLIADQSSVNAEVFKTAGFNSTNDLLSVWTELSSEFDLLIHDENATDNKAVRVLHIPLRQLITQTTDINVSFYSSIKQITLTTTGTTGAAKVIFSFDSGASWRTYTGSAWAAKEPTAHDVAASGITAADVAAIPAEAWTEVTGTLRVAYCLAKSAVTDDLAVASLAITGDTVSWELANQDDYQCSYPTTTTMQIKLLSDGSYKINCVEQK